DTATAREVLRLDCHAMNSAFSPDGKHLAICTQPMRAGKAKKEIRIIEVANGKEVAWFPWGTEDFPESLVFSPDGKLLACGSYTQSCLIEVTTGKVRQRLPGAAHMAFTPDGKIIAGSIASQLRLFDTSTGRELHHRPSGFGGWYELAISPDGRRLASLGPEACAIKVWDTASGRLIQQWSVTPGEDPHGLAFAPDGQTLLVGRWNWHVEFWDSLAGKQLRSIALRDRAPVQEHCGYLLLHASVDGKHLCTVEENRHIGRRWQRLAIWESATGKLERDYAVTSWAWSTSADGLALALPKDDGMDLRDVENGGVRFHIAGWQGGIIAASPDQRLIALLGIKGMGTPVRTDKVNKVGLWEAATGKEAASVTVGPAVHLALVAGGRCLVTIEGSLLRVW